MPLLQLVSREHLLIAILTTLLICLPSPSPSTQEKATGPSTSSHVSLSPVQPSSTNASSLVPQTCTHNLHSELLLTLSPNNNISDSIRRHGISDSTDVLAVVRLGPARSTEESVWKGMEGLIQGELVSLDQLDSGDHVDWARLDKVSYDLASQMMAHR